MSVSGIGRNNSVSEVYSNYIQQSTTASTRASVNDNSHISAFKDKNDGAPNLEELYNKKTQAQADLNELQSQGNDTQSQINDRTEEINNSIENGEQDTTVNAEFDKAKDDYDKAKTEYDEADVDYTEAQNELDEAQTELEEAQAEFDEAQAEFDEATAAKEAAEQKLSTLFMEQSKNEVEILANQQKRQLNEIQLSENAANIESTESEISSVESELASLGEGDTPEARSQIAQRRAALEARLNELQAKLQQLQAEKQQLEAEKANLLAEQFNLMNERDRIRSDISNTQAEINAQAAAAAAAQASMEDAQTRIDESQTIVDDAQTRMDDAESRRNAAQAEMDEAQDRMDEAEEAMKEEDPELNEAINEDEELQALKEDFEQIQQNIELKQQEISQLDMEIAEAEAKTASLKAAQATEADEAFEKAAAQAGCSVAASAAEAKDNVAKQKYGKAYDELTKEEQLGIDTGIQGEITLDVMDKARQMLEENPNNKAAQDVLRKGQQSLDAHEQLAGASLNECLNNMSDEMKSGANAAMEHARAEARAQGIDPEQAAMQALTDFAEDNVANPSLDAGEQAAIISVIGAAADYIDATVHADQGREIADSLVDEIQGGMGSDVIARGGFGETRGPNRGGAAARPSGAVGHDGTVHHDVAAPTHIGFDEHGVNGAPGTHVGNTSAPARQRDTEYRHEEAVKNPVDDASYKGRAIHGEGGAAGNPNAESIAVARSQISSVQRELAALQNDSQALDEHGKAEAEARRAALEAELAALHSELDYLEQGREPDNPRDTHEGYTQGGAAGNPNAESMAVTQSQISSVQRELASLQNAQPLDEHGKAEAEARRAALEAELASLQSELGYLKEGRAADNSRGTHVGYTQGGAPASRNIADEIYGGDGNDIIYEGESDDTVRYPGMSTAFSVAQMQMTDYQNAGAIQEQILASTVHDPEQYDAIVEELAANGIEITTEDDQKGDDIASCQAMIAAASTGMLDYDALAASLEEAGEGSLSAYIGEKLLEAHNNGTPLNEVDFGTELLNPLSADSVAVEGQPGALGGGITTTYSVGRMNMVDYQNSQGLIEAAQRGLVDMEALNAAAQDAPGLTGEAMAYISEVEANGGDYEAYTFEQFREDNAGSKAASLNEQYAELVKKQAEQLLAEGFRLPEGAEEMAKSDMEYIKLLQEQMDKAQIKNMDNYEAVIADLKAQGIEITTEDDQKAEDLASTQAMLAAASTGVLDYDALAASLEEAGDGSLSAYVGEKLLAAHDAGIDVKDIEFESDRINTPEPTFKRPDDKQEEQAGAGGMSSAFSIAQMQMVDYQNAQGLLQAADQGLIDENALNALIEQSAQISGTATMTTKMMEYISAVQAHGGDFSTYTYEQFTQDQQSLDAVNAQYQEVAKKAIEAFIGNSTNGDAATGGLSTAFSVAQMQMTDYQNSQLIQGGMAAANIADMDNYEAIIEDLKANGVEIDVPEDQKEDDIASTQAMLAAASAGILDYDALQASLEESGEGSLSAYIGEKLIAAHDAGIDVKDIEFESDLIRPDKPQFELPEGAGASGLATVYSVAQMQMVDYQEANGLIQAAQQGLIDQNALNILIEQGAQNAGNMTAKAMEYIAYMAADGGGDFSAYTFEQFTQDQQNQEAVNAQYQDVAQKAIEAFMGNNVNGDAATGGLSTAFSAAQMQMTDYQNAVAIQNEIAKTNIADMNGYEAVVEDLQANGVEIDVPEELKADDLASTQAMLAAASAGILDYDALQNSLEESGEGTLAAYVGEKLIAAHTAGLDVTDIKFDSDLIRTHKPVFEMPESTGAGAGGMSTVFSVAQMQMVDYQAANGLLQAAHQGLIDQNALSVLLEQSAQNTGTMTARAMEYISYVAADGGDFEAHDFETFSQEYTGKIQDTNEAQESFVQQGGEGNDIQQGPGMSTAFSIAQMQMVDYQNTQAIQEQIAHSAINDSEEYNAVLEDLEANGVALDVDPEAQAADMEATQAMLAAASAGVLDYEALAASLDKAGEGTLAAYVGEKLLEAQENGTPLNDIDFGTELLSPMSADSVAVDQSKPFGGMTGAIAAQRAMMVDYQNSQSLVQAFEHGYIDMDAVSAAVEDGSLGGLTGNVLNYITDAQANGKEVSQEGYEAYVHEQEHAKHNEKLLEGLGKDLIEVKGGKGDDTLKQIEFSLPEQAVQMAKSDMENVRIIQDNINKANIKNLDDYHEVVDDLQANGVELDIPEELQAEDLASTQAMLAAASTGILDYDALKASLEEAENGSLSAYIGEKLIAAHDAGLSIQDIEFDSERINFTQPAYNLPAQVGGAGGLSTAFSVGQMQMVDYQAAQGLLQAAQLGLVDQGALGVILEQSVQNTGTMTAKAMGYIFKAAEGGGEVNAEDFAAFCQEYEAKLQENNEAQDASSQNAGEGYDEMAAAFTHNEQIQQMIMTDYQNAQIIQGQIQHSAINDAEEYNAILEDLQANGVALDIDPEAQAADLESTQAMLAAASVGMLDYDALAASLEKADEGTLSSYVAEKLLEAHENGTALNDIDFGTELLSPLSAESVAVNPDLPSGGLASSIAIGRMQMVDYQNSQSLIQAAEHGYLDMDAVGDALENGQFGNLTTSVLSYLDEAQANGKEISREGYEKYVALQKLQAKFDEISKHLGDDHIEVKGGDGSDNVKHAPFVIKNENGEIVYAPDGGNGNDTVIRPFPGDGDDHIKPFPGTGDDHIKPFPGTGDDHIRPFPGTGDDHIRPFPGDGDDHIRPFPGTGDDHIRPFPGTGDDHIRPFPGTGDDHIRPFPGTGDDHIKPFPGTGDDHIKHAPVIIGLEDGSPVFSNAEAVKEAYVDADKD